MADVVMPQMGESIAEGTIVRWIKKVGDRVERDEPLFEISTDKVDAEIPSPVAGVIAEIRAHEGETVPVNSVVAIIGSEAAAQTSPVAAPPRDERKPAPQEERKPAPQKVEARKEPPAKGAPIPAPPAKPVAAASGSDPSSPEDAIRQRSSPLVRRIAKEHHVDISQIHGSGIAGRVTKHDILDYLGHEGQGQAGTQERQEGADARPRPARTATVLPMPSAPSFEPGATERVEKMSVMRKKIAEHMVASRRTSAHVHSVFEINFGRVSRIRDANKAESERSGAKLTYLSFIMKAAVDALRAVPIVNASVDGESIVYHKDVNIGIAVALDWGLIVPVVKRADERNLLGLSRAIADLAARARAKQLKPDDVSGGTFTITNPGVFGALFGMPIINQPQVAILGVGAVEKRPVVVDDAIAIRPMAYLTLGYDHRIIDGAVADQFMSHLKQSIENWDEGQV
jgi:2-oxoglutarate dehydrogenase E2 component (dihydrolipoamide succinyltransferase)